MMRNLLTKLALCSAVLGLCSAAAAQLKPSPIPVSWELGFRFHDPQRVSVYIPGERDPVVYWYMTYVVVNNSMQEVDFEPQFTLVTDRLDVVHSERRVSPEAYRAVARRVDDPLLQPPHRVTGKLLRGDDRARHGVAIWRDFNPEARGFTIYVSGLSGETKRMKNPAFDADKPEGPDNRRYFTFRKTLAIPYKFPGSTQSRHLVKPERVPNGQYWTMR